MPTMDCDEALFTPPEAVAMIQVLALARGKDGGASLEPDQCKAVSRVLDEAAASLTSVFER